MVELMTKNIKDMAEDSTEMTNSMKNDNTVEDSTKKIIEGQMSRLVTLLNDFNDCVQAFSERGWMKRAWNMNKQVKTLSRLDKDIVAPSVPEPTREPFNFSLPGLYPR